MINMVCKLCKEEDFFISEEHNVLNIDDEKSFTYNFWNRIDNIPGFISNSGLDLLYISLFVFGIDRINLRSNSRDSWSREFKVYIPVLDIEKWDTNKKLLEDILNFLSGDTWNLEFRSRSLTKLENLYKEKIENRKIVMDNTCSKMCMFSGGLDSFIGAIDLLNIDSNVMFVSHYGGGKGTKEYQDELRAECIKRYKISEDNYYKFYASAKDGVEDTTRTRSLMFFAHAVAVATSMNKNIQLFIPENGLISLNIPLTHSRLGTSSTRTTHPHYMSMLQQLLYNLGIKVDLINPYKFMTKGEMILNCKDKEFLIDNILNTMSCSHPDAGRMQGERESCHCGNCLPCTIRRASIKRAGIVDNTKYRDNNYSEGDTSRANFNSYMLGVKKFNPKFAFLNIQKSGPVVSDIIEYANLYIRGMNELKKFLEEV